MGVACTAGALSHPFARLSCVGDVGCHFGVPVTLCIARAHLPAACRWMCARLFMRPCVRTSPLHHRAHPLYKKGLLRDCIVRISDLFVGIE
jgi:hypothetical protein